MQILSYPAGWIAVGRQPREGLRRNGMLGGGILSVAAETATGLWLDGLGERPVSGRLAPGCDRGRNCHPG
jgi:hypothetical protein